jgi:hypothetical protein
VTRQVPKRTNAASAIKGFAIFFIVCSYLKASQNTWVSVKENEKKSDSISPRLESQTPFLSFHYIKT